MDYESNYFPSVSGDFKPKVMLLSEDLKMEGASGESLLDKAPFMDSSETLFPAKFDKVENLVEKLMSPPVLTEA